MDSPEDDNSSPCDSAIDSPQPILVDAEVQLDLNCDDKDVEHDGAFSTTFSDVEMKPLPQNCLPSALQVSSELVVITNNGNGFVSEQKVPISAFQQNAKRICIEQDGQTYILTLPDGLEYTGVVELQPKTFQHFDGPQLLNCQQSHSFPNKEGINQNWFTSREEKVTLHNKGHMWKQGMWAKEEIELLENNIQLYCKDHDIDNPSTIVFEMSKDERKDFYKTVAKGLNRPLFCVYRRVLRMYDNKNHVGKYTDEELETLKKLRSIYGNDWQAIGSAMGRSASSIKDRCRLMKDNCNQGKWTQAEEALLAEAVYELAKALPGEMISSGLSWSHVAEIVGTRSEKQCRTKWLNYLNWKIAGGSEWTRDDDLALICRVYAYNVADENDVDWAELAKGWSSVRSPQWLRGKWWNLKRHVPNSSMVLFQEVCEYLYQHFVMKLKAKDLAIAADLSGSLDFKPPLIQPVTLASTSPSIVVPSSTQECTPVVTLSNQPCVDIVTTSSVPVSPLLHSLEVLPQNIQISTSPQTFLLANSPQQIAAALPSNQIIIQTMTADEVQSQDSVLNSQHIIINASNSTTLTSLASTQIPSPPPSPTEEIEDSDSRLIIESYAAQHINESETLTPSDIEEHVNIKIKSEHLIADPMFAGEQSPECAVSDMESDKHIAHHLNHSQK